MANVSSVNKKWALIVTDVIKWSICMVCMDGCVCVCALTVHMGDRHCVNVRTTDLKQAKHFLDHREPLEKQCFDTVIIVRNINETKTIQMEHVRKKLTKDRVQ